jgi:hypothetical protein
MEAAAVRSSKEKKREAELATRRRYRSTSIFLWLAVLIAPAPAALLTLTPGFRPWQKWAALLWMALVVIVLHSPALILASTVLTGAALVLMALEIRVRRWFSHV